MLTDNNTVTVVSHHPTYLVYRGLKVYDQFNVRRGYPLTLAEQDDVAFMYQDALDHYGQD